MTGLRRGMALGVFALAALVAPGSVGAGPPRDASAGPDADAAGGARAVARVGTGWVTATELRDRIAAMPAFQRAMYGGTPEAVRRSILLDVVVPEHLLTMAAQKAGVERAPATAFALRHALAAAVVRAIRAHLGGPGAIADGRVRDYFDAHRDRYESPPQIQIWRILCPTEDEARSVLDTCKRDPTPKAFSDLARDHSQDKATYLRGGNLGFVAPDGASSFADFHVDPVLFRAAAGVRDGELVGAPVPEGRYFSVVWRRGTIAAVHRTFDRAAGDIRSLLYEAAIRAQTEGRVADLRAARLHGLDESPLEGLADSDRPEADGSPP